MALSTLGEGGSINFDYQINFKEHKKEKTKEGIAGSRKSRGSVH